MEIVLLRHGKPRVMRQGRVSPAGFGQWVAAYDGSGIDGRRPPPEAAIARVRECACVVCSSLPRSVESARALGVPRIDACDPMYREMDLPSAGWHFPRLPHAVWAVLFRLLWLAGYSGNAESFREARERAARCACCLAALAAERSSVVFVGHGSLNWFVAWQLRRMGWAGPWIPPLRFWGVAVYRAPGA